MTQTMSVPYPDFRVPDDLTELDQWVLWRFEAHKDKPTKVPYQANGQLADSTNPGTWTTFDEALRIWRRNRASFIATVPTPRWSLKT